MKKLNKLLIILIIIGVTVVVWNYFPYNSNESFALLDNHKTANRFYNSQIRLKDFDDVIAIADSQDIDT